MKKIVFSLLLLVVPCTSVQSMTRCRDKETICAAINELSVLCQNFVATRLAKNHCITGDDAPLDSMVNLCADRRPFANNKHQLINALRPIGNLSQLSWDVIKEKVFLLLAFVENCGCISDFLYPYIRDRWSSYTRLELAPQESPGDVRVEVRPFASDDEIQRWIDVVLFYLEFDIKKMFAIMPARTHDPRGDMWEASFFDDLNERPAPAQPVTQQVQLPGIESFDTAIASAEPGQNILIAFFNCLPQAMQDEIRAHIAQLMESQGNYSDKMQP